MPKDISQNSKSSTPTAKQVNLQYVGVQGVFWVMFLPMAAFSVVFLQSKQFSSFEIGVLLSLQALASIIAQPLISNFSSTHPKISLNAIVATMILVGSIAGASLYFLSFNFLITAFVFILYGITIASAPAFINALAMELNNQGFAINYGLARGVGSISFAIMSVILGKMVDSYSINLIFIFLLLAGSLEIFFLLHLKKPSTSVMDFPIITPDKATSSSLLAFLKTNKKFTGFCLATALIFAGNTCTNNFLPQIMGYLGGSITDQGIARSIAAASEFPTMVLFVFLIKKWNPNKLMIVAAFSFFLKSLAIFLAPSVFWLFAAHVLQMTSFGLFTPSAVNFSNSVVPNEHRVRAQALSMVSSNGIGFILGSIGGGIILDYSGVRSLLLVSTLFSLAGFSLIFFILKEKKISLSSLT